MRSLHPSSFTVTRGAVSRAWSGERGAVSSPLEAENFAQSIVFLESYAHKAGFFENANRRHVPRRSCGCHALDSGLRKRPFDSGARALGGDALALPCFFDAITDFGDAGAVRSAVKYHASDHKSVGAPSRDDQPIAPQARERVSADGVKRRAECTFDECSAGPCCGESRLSESFKFVTIAPKNGLDKGEGHRLEYESWGDERLHRGGMLHGTVELALSLDA